MTPTTKEEAAEWVVMVIRSRMALMSPHRKDAEETIEKFGLTASDLLEAAVRLTYRAS